MIAAPRRNRGSLLDSYCLQLGALVERRHTELALVTAKQQAETAARLAHEAMLQAQDADRAKAKFLANMTHELRTPLNAIIGFSEVIADARFEPSPDQFQYAQYIRDAGLRLLGIVNGVLDLARIDAGKLDLEEELVTLDEVVRAAVGALRTAIDKKGVKIECGKQFPRLLSLDAAKIKQVLVNLVSNAVKFSAPAGRITIKSSQTKTGDIVLAIGDRGSGIPREHLARVLEPFGQIEDHLTRQNEGAGLGLPIARALVGLHGGTLALTSESGVGTTVEVRLPASRISGMTEKASRS
jgi:signal transduction histidine kinase